MTFKSYSTHENILVHESVGKGWVGYLGVTKRYTCVKWKGLKQDENWYQ